MNMVLRRLALLACLLVAASPHDGLSFPHSAVIPTFDTPHDREFDFWIGEWDVNLRVRQEDASWQDKHVSRASIHRILGGKAILELWDEQKEGLEAIRGWSLRHFDHEAGEWVLYLNWPGHNRSGIGSLRGNFRHGRGEFFSQQESEDGTTTISRYTFCDISPTSLRWEDAYSKDGGETWSNNWIMEFTRRSDTATWPAPGQPHATYYDGARCDRPEFQTWERLVGAWDGSLKETKKSGETFESKARLTASAALDGCAVMALLHWEEKGQAREEFSFLSFNTWAEKLEQASLDDASGSGLRQAFGALQNDRIELRTRETDPAPMEAVWEFESEDTLRMTRSDEGGKLELTLERSTAENLLPAELAPFTPLLEDEWITEFPNGFRDVQIYEPMAGGKFLRNVHHVYGPRGAVVYEGETVYGWDAQSQELRWWYFNSTGGRIEGTIEAQEDGTLTYEGQNYAVGTQTPRVRGRFVLDQSDPDRFTSVTYFWKDDQWQVERELVYERRPARPKTRSSQH